MKKSGGFRVLVLFFCAFFMAFSSISAFEVSKVNQQNICRASQSFSTIVTFFLFLPSCERTDNAFFNRTCFDGVFLLSCMRVCDNVTWLGNPVEAGNRLIWSRGLKQKNALPDWPTDGPMYTLPYIQSWFNFKRQNSVLLALSNENHATLQTLGLLRYRCERSVRQREHHRRTRWHLRQSRSLRTKPCSAGLRSLHSHGRWRRSSLQRRRWNVSLFRLQRNRRIFSAKQRFWS